MGNMVLSSLLLLQIMLHLIWMSHFLAHLNVYFSRHNCCLWRNFLLWAHSICSLQNVGWCRGEVCVSSNETVMIDPDHSTAAFSTKYCVVSSWGSSVFISGAKETEGKVLSVRVKCSCEHLYMWFRRMTDKQRVSWESASHSRISRFSFLPWKLWFSTGELWFFCGKKILKGFWVISEAWALCQLKCPEINAMVLPWTC